MLDPMATAKAAARSTIQLDDNQRAATEHVQGPVLVIAGAGTGKTTVLTRRIAHLISNGYAHPSEILALTYADNAAAEMRQRVQAELQGTDVSGLQTVTFHAYCNELLKANGRGFGLLDDNDLWIYLRRHIRDLQLSYFVRAARVSQFLEDLINFIRRCHDELVGPEGGWTPDEITTFTTAGFLPASLGPTILRAETAAIAAVAIALALSRLT